MTAREAYQILINHNGELVCDKCYEFLNFYVFRQKQDDSKFPLFDSTFCVDKKTSKVSVFIPPNYKNEELLVRKEIKDFN